MQRMKFPIVFVSETPSCNASLANLCGRLLARCMRINLCEGPWSEELARVEWPKRLGEISSLVEREIKPRCAPSTTHHEALRLVFYGERASDAARLTAAPRAVLRPWGAIAGLWVEVAVIPHARELNRDATLRWQTSEFLKNLLTIAEKTAKLVEP